MILIENDGTHRREFIGKQGQGAIGRAIIGYIHHRFAQCLGQYRMFNYRRKKLAKHLLTIPIEDYDCDFHELKI